MSKRTSGVHRVVHQAMHYRFYEVDADDHFLIGYSAECPSDAAAMQAARRLMEQRIAVVEVWQAEQPVGRLSAVEDLAEQRPRADAQLSWRMSREAR